MIGEHIFRDAVLNRSNLGGTPSNYSGSETSLSPTVLRTAYAGRGGGLLEHTFRDLKSGQREWMTGIRSRAKGVRRVIEPV